MKSKKEKVKVVYRIAVIYFAVMTLMLICPPITRLFDRNDIWIGIMPLSQVYILFFSALIVAGMGLLYAFDKKISGGDK